VTPEDALTPIAEIAIALAGFTSVVAVFRRSEIGSWNPEAKTRIRNLLLLSFTMILCALLPFALSGLSDSPFIVWGMPSLILGTAQLLVVSVAFVRIRSGTITLMWPLVTWISFPIAFVVGSLLILSAFSILLAPSAAILVLGLLWSLVNGGTVLATTLSFLWSSE
jgi:hypothetical protein